MKIKFTFLLLLLQIIVYSMLGQNRANIWYFGGNAGLDFSRGEPLALTNGMLFTKEGCSSITDENGNLLFYTDGITVWNKDHQVMVNGNGLLGHISSTQSALVVPKPLSSTIYYIFTVDAQGGLNGLNYSEVDMSLQGGLGEVTSNKNIQLVTPTTEKLTAVLHANARDIWVITHEWNSNAFYSYLVTSDGVYNNPTISKSGSIIGGEVMLNAKGAMKVSPDGARLAVAHYFYNEVQLFDFNDSTGLISNPITISKRYTSYGPYGVEFSPNGKILYISSIGSVNRTGDLYQYDLTSSDIPSTERVISANLHTGVLQLAPNGKIYMGNYHENGSNFLSSINNPNNIGVDSNFIKNALDLSGKKSFLGLPSFVVSFILTFSSNNLCFGEATFTNLIPRYDSLSWDFDDPKSGDLNISEASNPSHIYYESGDYIVSLKIYRNGSSFTSKQKLFINKPSVNLGEDKYLCKDQTLLLDATTPNATYLWQNGSTNSTFDVTQPGKYWVEITSTNDCSMRDTINVYPPVLARSLGNDTLICTEKALLLDVTTPNASYLWQDGSTNATYNVIQAGAYWVDITINNCISRSSMNVTIENCDPSLVMPNVFTPNGDDYNELLMPIEVKYMKSVKTSIYNRWGKLIYSTEDPMIKWDGKQVNGQPSAAGVYYWVSDYTTSEGKMSSIKGYFNLMK